jgi:hypothetical protein
VGPRHSFRGLWHGSAQGQLFGSDSELGLSLSGLGSEFRVQVDPAHPAAPQAQGTAPSPRGTATQAPSQSESLGSQAQATTPQAGRGLQTVQTTLRVAPEPEGANVPTCGGAQSAPCATVAYAVNVAGSAVPVSSLLHIDISPGWYNVSSCGAVGTRPINVTGAGPGVTVVDCQGRTRFLIGLASTYVSGMTITGGFAPVLVRVSRGVSVDGGGAIAVLWSGTGVEAVATFRDLVFVNNHVGGQADFTNATLGLVGGGAVLVAGANRAGGATVTVQDCVFTNNSAVVVDVSPVNPNAPPAALYEARPDRGEVDLRSLLLSVPHRVRGRTCGSRPCVC